MNQPITIIRIILTTFLLPLVQLSVCGQSQECKIKYSYDLSGNRTQRTWYCHTPGDPEDKRLDQLENVEMAIWPNPTTEELNVSIPEEFANGVVELVTTSGSVVATQNVSSSITLFDVKMLQAGQYFVRYMRGNETLITTFIKE